MNLLIFTLLFFAAAIGATRAATAADESPEDVRYKKLKQWKRKMTQHQLPLNWFPDNPNLPVTRVTCGRACSTKEGCYSFSYSYSLQRCNLHGAFSMENGGTWMTGDSNFNHFDLECYCNNSDIPRIENSTLSLGQRDPHCGESFRYICNRHHFMENGSLAAKCRRNATLQLPATPPVCAPCPSCPRLPGVGEPRANRVDGNKMCEAKDDPTRIQTISYRCDPQYIQVNGIACWKCEYWNATWVPEKLHLETHNTSWDDHIDTSRPHCELVCGTQNTYVLKNVGEQGNISSPNWPHIAAYSPKEECRFVFLAPYKKAINFTAVQPLGMTDPHLTKTRCNEGTPWHRALSFYDGSPTEMTLFARWCSVPTSQETAASRTNQVILLVDYGHGRRQAMKYIPGYNIAYECVDPTVAPPEHLSSAPCEGTPEATPDFDNYPITGYLRSPNYPDAYTESIMCGWRFVLPQSTTFSIQFGEPHKIEGHDRLYIHRFGDTRVSFNNESIPLARMSETFSSSDPRDVVVTLETDATRVKNSYDFFNRTVNATVVIKYNRHELLGFNITYLVCPSGFWDDPDCPRTCPKSCPTDCNGFTGGCS